MKITLATTLISAPVEKPTVNTAFYGQRRLDVSGALTTVADLLTRYENVGVVLRSYAWFDREPVT